MLLRNLLDIFAPRLRKMGAQVDLTSSMRYVDGLLRFLPLDVALASGAVFHIVSGSDGQAD